MKKMQTVRPLTTLAFLLLGLTAQAQRKGVIASAETGLPLRDCTIYTNNGQSYTTLWTGEYDITMPFQSVTIVKPNYMSYTLELSEMADTIYLLPRFNTLAEVTVWGKRRRFSKNAVSSWQPSYVPNTPATGGVGGLDILGIFEPKRGMSSKDKEKHEQVIREY